MAKLSKKELKKLIDELIVKLEVKFNDNFTGLVLFGSYAKGTQKKYSDIDFLLTFKELPKFRTYRFRLVRDLIMDLEDKYLIDINPIIATEKNLNKTYLIVDIADYSQIIIDKNKKISFLFKDIKEDYKKNLVNKFNRKNYYSLWISENLI